MSSGSRQDKERHAQDIEAKDNEIETLKEES